MSKFKVGDRVVVVRAATEEADDFYGHRGVIKSIHSSPHHEFPIELDNFGLMFKPEELEFEHVYDALSSPDSKVEVSPSGDVVNHPSHYADGWSNGAEVIDITEHLNFNRGNAVKYLARAGKKGGSEKELEDLQKALWYVRREVLRRGGTV